MMNIKTLIFKDLYNIFLLLKLFYQRFTKMVICCDIKKQELVFHITGLEGSKELNVKL